LFLAVRRVAATAAIAKHLDDDDRRLVLGVRRGRCPDLVAATFDMAVSVPTLGPE
jgi:hypothetical protein